nr:hypothetical protein CFP56_29938 [Quercus suber]
MSAGCWGAERGRESRKARLLGRPRIGALWRRGGLERLKFGRILLCMRYVGGVDRGCAGISQGPGSTSV